jgi:hypothetical protein
MELIHLKKIIKIMSLSQINKTMSTLRIMTIKINSNSQPIKNKNRMNLTAGFQNSN